VKDNWIDSLLVQHFRFARTCAIYIDPIVLRRLRLISPPLALLLDLHNRLDVGLFRGGGSLLLLGRPCSSLGRLRRFRLFGNGRRLRALLVDNDQSLFRFLGLARRRGVGFLNGRRRLLMGQRLGSTGRSSFGRAYFLWMILYFLDHDVMLGLDGFEGWFVVLFLLGLGRELVRMLDHGEDASFDGLFQRGAHHMLLDGDLRVDGV
jgi:hypothetical protein